MKELSNLSAVNASRRQRRHYIRLHRNHLKHIRCGGGNRSDIHLFWHPVGYLELTSMGPASIAEIYISLLRTGIPVERLKLR